MGRERILANGPSSESFSLLSPYRNKRNPLRIRHMRQFARDIWGLLRGCVSPLSKPRKAKRLQRRQLELETLEDRSVPAASSTISGVAFVDLNHNGIREPAKEAVLPGAPIHLTGVVNGTININATTKTDASGTFRFLNVPQGTVYHLTGGPSTALLGGSSRTGTVPLGGLPVQNQNIGFQGLTVSALSMRRFLSNFQGGDVFPVPGTGSAKALPRSNEAPNVTTAIQNFSVAKNAADSVFDLTGNFSDIDFTNTNLADSRIRFNTTMGPIEIELFDKQAPKTVANFFNYITSGRYDGTIFHRHATTTVGSLVQDFVLQGGGYTFDPTDPMRLTHIVEDATIQNEFSLLRPNTVGTIAMAKKDGLPNSAQSEFFFNLKNNSSPLNTQNGGFTVFGKIVTPDTNKLGSTVKKITALPVKGGATADVFKELPLVNYPVKTNFPTDRKSVV